MEIIDSVESAMNGVDAPEMDRTLLETWWLLLENAPEDPTRVSPAEALALLGRHSFLTLGSLPRYSEVFYGLLSDARRALNEVIAENSKALINVVDDMELNHGRYLEVILLWTQVLEQVSGTWEPSMEQADGVLAALSDASAFLVGDQGLLGHLGQLGFVLSDEDRELLNVGLVREEGGE